MIQILNSRPGASATFGPSNLDLLEQRRGETPGAAAGAIQSPAVAQIVAFLRLSGAREEDLPALVEQILRARHSPSLGPPLLGGGDRVGLPLTREPATDERTVL